MTSQKPHSVAGSTSFLPNSRAPCGTTALHNGGLSWAHLTHTPFPVCARQQKRKKRTMEPTAPLSEQTPEGGGTWELGGPSLSPDRLGISPLYSLTARLVQHSELEHEPVPSSGRSSAGGSEVSVGDMRDGLRHQSLPQGACVFFPALPRSFPPFAPLSFSPPFLFFLLNSKQLPGSKLQAAHKG